MSIEQRIQVPPTNKSVLDAAVDVVIAKARAARWTRVAVYGDGQHTLRLLSAWNAIGASDIKIACILDDVATGTLGGIPVVTLAELKFHAPQVILISSDSSEETLYHQAQAYNLGVPLVRLYGSDDEPTSTSTLQKVLRNINELPQNWHKSGALGPGVLSAIVELAVRQPINCSMETGAGKSTLLLSHLSKRHLVFTLDVNGWDAVVRSSHLFNADSVQWVEGPSQVTLPRHQFVEPLDLALIDGPHAYPFPDMEYYYVYPHLVAGGLLIVDDIHIPTITNLFNYLKEEEMFSLERVVGTTAFFRRTKALTFPTQYDGWWWQGFNRRHYPVGDDQKVRELLSADTQSAIARYSTEHPELSSKKAR